MAYRRGDVVKGPDLLGPHAHRPYVLISTPEHPFHGEEGIWVVVTTTERPQAIPLEGEAFRSGGLDRESFASPWNVVTIKTADMDEVEGQLVASVVDEIVEEVGRLIGLRVEGASSA